jgi:PTS system nitrogen regulatory IIA component
MSNNANEMCFDLIFTNVNVNNTKDAFQYITKQILHLIGTPEERLMAMLTNREKKQNSGVGNGVAILDAKLPRLTRPIILFLKLNQAIEYQAADGDPVDMISLILSPEFENFEHLRRIAKVARFFSHDDICNDLRQADHYNDVKKIVDHFNLQKKIAA